MKKKCLILILLLLNQPSFLWADHAIHKLSRGIENIITSPVEFPIQYVRLNHEGKSTATVIISGTIEGAGWTLGRIAGGALETLTFVIPLPERFEPLMNPPTPLASAREQARRFQRNEG